MPRILSFITKRNTTKAHIFNLPVEVIAQIIQYLDADSLRALINSSPLLLSSILDQLPFSRIAPSVYVNFWLQRVYDDISMDTFQLLCSMSDCLELHGCLKKRQHGADSLYRTSSSWKTLYLTWLFAAFSTHPFSIPPKHLFDKLNPTMPGASTHHNLLSDIAQKMPQLKATELKFQATTDNLVVFISKNDLLLVFLKPPVNTPLFPDSVNTTPDLGLHPQDATGNPSLLSTLLSSKTKSKDKEENIVLHIEGISLDRTLMDCRRPGEVFLFHHLPSQTYLVLPVCTREHSNELARYDYSPIFSCNTSNPDRITVVRSQAVLECPHPRWRKCFGSNGANWLVAVDSWTHLVMAWNIRWFIEGNGSPDQPGTWSFEVVPSSNKRQLNCEVTGCCIDANGMAYFLTNSTVDFLCIVNLADFSIVTRSNMAVPQSQGFFFDLPNLTMRFSFDSALYILRLAVSLLQYPALVVSFLDFLARDWWSANIDPNKKLRVTCDLNMVSLSWFGVCVSFDNGCASVLPRTYLKNKLPISQIHAAERKPQSGASSQIFSKGSDILAKFSEADLQRLLFVELADTLFPLHILSKKANLKLKYSLKVLSANRIITLPN